MKESILSAIGQPRMQRKIEQSSDKISFKQRKELAMRTAENAIETANMVAVANQLLEEHSIEDINAMEEEELEGKCDPYDAANIVVICQKIESNKKEAN